MTTGNNAQECIKTVNTMHVKENKMLKMEMY